ncbi:hypothetical protein H0H87_005556 [Tephrocybe sp. NHM501043]|nr:hypothetical protein H0H87_005556 [Tephrocybe sp. NHM501043]
MLSLSPSFARLVVVAALARYAAAATDYLIVGGGTAGLVLAERLTEDPNVNVLVIEAGGDGLGKYVIRHDLTLAIANYASSVDISDISRVGAAWGTDIDWQFPTEPLTYANNRQLTPSPRGKVLGGSSSINGDVYERGDAIEYDQWETLGNTGWNFNSLIAAAKKGEQFYAPGVNDNIDYVLGDHGTTGHLPTSYGGVAPDFHNAVIEGVVNAGGSKSMDQAGGVVTGIAHVTNARLPSNNTRSTSATGYYFPFSHRPNLQVTLHSTVTRLLWTSSSRVSSGQAVASGVEYVDANGATQTANATNVILSGGTWGTPPILERSGIGNATFLESLGIQSVVDLPGVGENLNEQTLVAMQWQLNSSLPCPGSPFLLNVEPLETTFGAGNLAEVESLLNAQPEGLSTSLWDMHKRLYEKSAPWIEGYIYLASPADGPSTLTWYPVNLHPLSRGSVHIKSSDGLEYPKIIYNFFQNPVDLYIMAAGAQRVQEIVSTPPISDYIVGKLRRAFCQLPSSPYSPVAPIAPAAGVTSIEDLSEYIKEQAGYTNHIIGTALLAPREDGGVVDPNLKVYGTKNVFVVDASVIPLQPSAHTQATVYALAEHAATLFTGN